MFPEPSKWSLSLVHWATQSWGRLLIWQLSRRQSLTLFTRSVSHKHSLPKKLAVHRVLYPSMLTESWVEGKSVEEKDAQPTERTAALWELSSKIDSRIWVNFTRNGLRLGSRHQEPQHTDVSRNLATVVVRGVLPGLRRRRTGLLPIGPKSSFQMRASFAFNLETKVLESGVRVEKLIAQVAWSPVLSFQFVIIWCAMSSAGVGPLCFFWKPTSLHPFTKTFWSTSCFLLLTSFLKMLISFSSRIWHLPTLPKAPKVKWPWCWCTWLASKLTRPEPHRESMGYCQEENEKQETKKCRWAEDHCQRNLGFHTTSAVPHTDHLHATPHWGSN